MSEISESHEPVPSSAERISAASSWSSGAREVATQTLDSKAQRIYDSYIHEAGVGQYVASGLKWLAGSQEPKVVLVPVMSREIVENANISLFQQAEGPEIARYVGNRPGRILFNGDVRMASEWKGLVLLHEAAHADADYMDKYDSSDNDSHWQEEVDVFRLEHRWMARLGGDLYTSFVAQEVSRFLDQYDDHGGSGGSIPVLRKGHELDRAFGPSASGRETAVRRTATWLDVVYQMFEQKYGAEQGQRDMVSFTKSIHGRPDAK